MNFEHNDDSNDIFITDKAKQAFAERVADNFLELCEIDDIIVFDNLNLKDLTQVFTYSLMLLLNKKVKAIDIPFRDLRDVFEDTTSEYIYKNLFKD